MYAYEDLSNVDRSKAVIAAQEILKSGWARRSYPVLQLSQPLPWRLESQAHRSWNFYIQCLDMLDSLLRAHSETQDEQYLKPCVPVILDWIEQHSDPESAEISPLAWYDMSVGLRAYRLAYVVDAGIRSRLLDDATYARMWKSLEQHQAYLCDDGRIAFHNNHGFYQVAGQLAMGRRFAATSEAMAQAYAQGKTRLLAMLETQFAEDGVHREHSPDYHRMVYETLKAMIDAGLVDDPQTMAFADRIERSLSWFVLPNQHIANFGDSDYRLVSRKPAEAQRKWRTPEMQYVVSNGAVGTLPEVDCMTFPQAGYFVARKPAREQPNVFKQSSYLAQTAAFHSRTHKHADDLSFIWSDRGADLLVDAGRYGYIGKAEQGSKLWLDGYWYSDPKRVYVETTCAHNTIEFDGLNYQRKGAKPYGSALGRTARTGNGVLAVETEVKQHGSIRHARVLVFLPGQWLLVFDWFHDNADTPHAVRQWFHLAPELALLPDGPGYMVPVTSSQQPLRVVPLLDGARASRPHLAEEGESMQGWWSPKERELVPNYAFCYEQEGLSTGCFGTLLSFSTSLAGDTAWSKVNASGRKGQFRWTDERGRHSLSLQRPSEGTLLVEYQSPPEKSA